MKPDHSRLPPAPVTPGRFVRFAAIVDGAARDAELLLKACREERGRRHVHDLRVASRRLQACLHLASALLPRETCRAARRALADVLAALGRLRDATVQRQLARERCSDLSDCARLDRLLARRERHERKAAVAALRQVRLRRPLRAAVAALHARDGSAGMDRRLEEAVRRVLLRDWERMRERWPHASADSAAFHRARVALKRYRYELETWASLFRRRPARGTAALRLRQRQLGELHDDELLLARVTKWVARGKLPPSLRHALQFVVQRRAARLRRACLTGPPPFVSGQWI